MASLKCALAFVLLAATIGRQVDADDESIRDLCQELSSEMSRFKDLKTNDEKAFDFAKNFIGQNTGFLSSDRLLIKAWRMVKDGQCKSSSSFIFDSWNYVRLLYVCRSTKKGITVLDEPLKQYYKKCLNVEYMSEKFKMATNTMVKYKVDFVDAAFIRKYYEDNPNDTPLHLSSLGKFERKGDDFFCCKPKRSYGAIKDAIERNFRKKGKKPTDEFYANPDAVDKYLRRKLFKPCADYVSFYGSDLRPLLNVALWYYEGGEQQFIAELDQQAKDILFRYKYCEMLEDHEDAVSSRLAKEFM